MTLGEAQDSALPIGGAALWVVATDKIGHINQCIALTDALGVAPSRQEWIRGFNLRDGFVAKTVARACGLFRSLRLLRGVPSGPLVLVISGRSSEFTARLLRWRLGRRLFVISVGAPIRFPQTVDLAVMSAAVLPKWQRRRHRFGASVTLEEIAICGALARKFEAAEVPAKAPSRRLIAVFIGGENKNFSLDGARFRAGIAQVCAYARGAGADVEIVLSRRTSHATEAIVRDAAAGAPVTIRDREDSTAYRSLLGRADTFLVTPDSVTMLSEVCLTGKPVYAMDLDVLPGSDGEGERLVDHMTELGVVRRFEGGIEPYEPACHLDEAARIAPILAGKIRQRFRRGGPGAPSSVERDISS